VPGPTSEHIAGATAGAGSSDVEPRGLSTADVRAIFRAEVGQRVDAARNTSGSDARRWQRRCGSRPLC
jgi:hypothetical protein